MFISYTNGVQWNATRQTFPMGWSHQVNVFHLSKPPSSFPDPSNHYLLFWPAFVCSLPYMRTRDICFPMSGSFHLTSYHFFPSILPQMTGFHSSLGLTNTPSWMHFTFAFSVCPLMGTKADLYILAVVNTDGINTGMLNLFPLDVCPEVGQLDCNI